MRLKYSSYIANENLTSFYGSVIPKGTILYVKNEDRNRIAGCKYGYRFVFDTMPEGKAHDYPKGNKRVAIWCNAKQEFEEKITPNK